jgi:hypothetical protein
MTEKQIKYHTAGHSIAGAIECQMFGKPCFKINGKAFMCFYDDMAVFKLKGNPHNEALSLTGSVLFDPFGRNRPMKEWVQVPFEHSGKWLTLAIDASVYAAGNA